MSYCPLPPPPQPAYLNDSIKEDNEKLAMLVSLTINRLFNNQRVLIKNLQDVDTFLIRLVEIIKRLDNFNNCSSFLCNSLFSMIYNLIEFKLQSNESKYLDFCILNDLADCLIGYIGKSYKINTVFITHADALDRHKKLRFHSFESS
jgi:hypothetical protein